MTAGTKIVQGALARIGAHSVPSPASPESLEIGRDVLNSMSAMWLDDDIDIGVVPLQAIGDELSEPMGLRNTIINNLALELHPLFPGSTISPELLKRANKGYNDMVRKYQAVTIPNRAVRDTLPLGQGERSGRTFVKRGSTVG